MRYLAIIYILFSAWHAQAQTSEIISISNSDRLMRGYINEDQPITVYLKVANRSDNNGYVFSVTGWYKSDSMDTPIPLVGVWSGELHLFASSDTKFIKDMAQLTYENEEGVQYLDNFIYEIASFAAKIPAITERFHLDFQENKFVGEWHKAGQELPVVIRSPSTEVLRTVQYLKLPNGDYFDLSNLGLPNRTEYEIEASINNSKNILLHYVYHANLNYMGRCGGATNSGKLALVFDDSFALVDETNVEFENCYRDLVVDDIIKVNDTTTKYVIMDYNTSKEEVYVVDRKLATIRKK